MNGQARVTIPPNAIADLCRRYHVRELSLFGSALRDDFRADSDVDFLVDYEPDARVGYLDFLALQEELEGIVGRSVHLVPRNGLRPAIRDEVLATSQAVYEA